jgi:AcrR family transcriptional regulator
LLTVKSGALDFVRRSRRRHTGGVDAPRTARARARVELTRTIKDSARRQLAEVGAQGLSLRAVARELGMVSSALYRYFPSRDELLTALIVDAYTALAETIEQAVAAETVPGEQWRVACHAVRAWARAHPHEYALIYGSPVAGYRAPQHTVAPAARVVQVFLDAVSEGWCTGALQPSSAGMTPSWALRAQADELAAHVAQDVPVTVLIRAVTAWTQLFGMISMELFGHLVGTLDPADEYFTHAVNEMAQFVGFR